MHNSQLINQFLTAERAGGAPETTLRSRRQHLTNLARYVPAFLLVTGDELVGWFASREWAIETRRSRRTTFRVFFTYLVEEGYREDNPALKLRRVPPSQPVARPAPARVYQKALMQAAPRERLMLRFAREAGLRRAEISLVHSDDLVEDILGVSLLVHGKGNRKRTVPLTDSLSRELLAWFDLNGEGFAFPGDRDGHLSAEYVGKLMARALPGNWTAHPLRHSFAGATYLVDRDVFAVQELLGHASPATTRRYVPRANDEHLRRTVNAAA